MDSLLSNFHSFSANKATILQEVEERGSLTYLKEKEERLRMLTNIETEYTQTNKDEIE